MYRIKREFFEKGDLEKILKGIMLIHYFHEERIFPEEFESLHPKEKELFEVAPETGKSNE